MVKVKTPKGTFDYSKSTRPDKKLMVTVEGKVIHFGDRNSEHYKDRTGIWSSKNHGDDKRRKSYLSRSHGIKDINGTLTAYDPTSANYHSINVLW